MPKFVAHLFRNLAFGSLSALFLFSGCGNPTDTIQAKATLNTDGAALLKLEEALPLKTGIEIVYKYKTGNIQVESVSLNEQTREAFPALPTTPHHYTMSMRYNGVFEFYSAAEAFLKEHEDFIKGLAIKERYDKVTDRLRPELEAERQAFPGAKAPEYTDAQKEEFDRLAQAMTDATDTLRDTHKVRFVITNGTEAGTYEVALNDPSEFVGDNATIEALLSQLLEDSEDFVTLLDTVSDVALTNILAKKIEAIDAYLP